MADDNVTAFPVKVPENVVWRCDCGCLTHYLNVNGSVSCGNCGAAQDGGSGDWRQNFPVSDSDFQKVKSTDPVVVDLNDDQAMLNRTLGLAIVAETDAVLVFQNSGSVHAWWTRADSVLTRADFEKQVDMARAMIFQKGN
jgi:hypothetical protein